MKSRSCCGLRWRWLLLGWGGISIASGQIDVVSFNANGHLSFSDTGGTEASGYRVEWSESPAGLWRESWEELCLLRTDGGVGEATVPVFYRVVRIEGAEAIPAAVTDADYANGGAPDTAKVELGRLLFFDKVLSGNRNISCATCHHSMVGTGDGLSLSLGEGGRGLGVTRDTGTADDAVHERVPRNAPAVFNLGAREFEIMFDDGRVEVDATHPQGFRSPADLALPPQLENVLAAQAMFPVTSATEMAGQSGENPIADLGLAGDLPGVWEELARRLRDIPAYVEQFIDVFDDVGAAEDITYVHAANAMAAFEAEIWRSDQSPFDRFVRGETGALSPSALRGMQLFYGKARCVDCHSGKFQTDHQFHAIGVPQVGPGKGDGASGHEDFGRERVTGKIADRFRFRTPSLRNVALTGPWGHDGAFGTLEAVVAHHLDPAASLAAYQPAEHLLLPSRADLDESDLTIFRSRLLAGEANRWRAVGDASEIAPVDLTETEFYQLIDFLHALTDPAMIDLKHDVPRAVPSGLPVFE